MAFHRRPGRGPPAGPVNRVERRGPLSTPVPTWRAGERVLALDDFEKRLLLPEEVLLRAGDDLDGDVAGQAGGGHVGQRPGELVDLGGEAGLEPDEGLGGADGEGGDGHALDQLVRV